MVIKLIFLIFLSNSLTIIYCHRPPPTACGLYGVGPCQFVPAPSGHTPSCARPGKTYCEHADNYPVYLIKHLVRKWGLDARNLIIDETPEEFHTFTVPPFHHNYQPYHNSHDDHEITHLLEFFGPTANHLGGGGGASGGIDGVNVDDGHNFNGYKYDVPKTVANHFPQEPIYIPKPINNNNRDHTTDYIIYTHLASPTTAFNQKPTNSYVGNGNRPNNNNNNNGGYHYGPKVTNYNSAEWFKRYVRDLSLLKRKSDNDNIINYAVDNSTMISDLFRTDDEKNLHRVKRQSSGRTQLCQTNSQFIMPQAALNSQGNWMFVVNEMNTARQLVKTETCASTVCSNICQLPNGYNSRCEQKYVQKRLIALNSNGQNLYTDTFWFPSCCVCTISNL